MNTITSSCSIETKQTTKDYINFSEVKQAQIDYGLAIESDKGILIRCIAVSEGQPDYIYLRNTPAYIYIKYPDFFCGIRVSAWIKEKKGKFKSLSSSRAIKISEIVVNL